MEYCSIEEDIITLERSVKSQILDLVIEFSRFNKVNCHGNMAMWNAIISLFLIGERKTLLSLYTSKEC